MSPRELQGLQALAKSHGGSLTINPETGLAEAGFLEQVLPIVAAAAATYFTAGAAAPAIAGALGGGAMATTAGGILAGAGSGALISGGVAAAQGKDAGKAALMGGLGGAVSGGLGAYDGAATADLFTGAAPVPTEGLTNVASNTPITTDMAGKLGYTDTAQLNQLAATQSSIAPQNMPVSQMTPDQFAAAGSSRFGAPVGAQDLSTGVGTPPASTLQNAPGAAKTLAAPNSYYSGLAPDSYIQKAGIQSLPALGLLQDEGEGALSTPEEQSKLRRISPNFRAQDPVQPNPYYRAQYPSYASGGLADLGAYSDGGRLLKGPGDGMSDSIPAKIGSKQPARLADGEFVIPADVVSHLGNGSTDAGAKRLYAMMAKVRSARTGKKKQAPAVNTGKFLPA
jgi:hypothetical protein